ncbi:MAG: biotin/lipoyl-containing protein, partial [Pseudomonadota bacterium]
MAVIEVRVPDIGDFSDVPVIGVLVSPGDTVAAEDPLIELESDKATMEVPSPAAGKIAEIKVKEGDSVSEGTLIVTLEAEGATEAPAAAPTTPPASSQPAAPAAATSDARADMHAQFLVLGSGPGGYTAAFRAADLGLQTVLIERNPTLGGVCLNVGCIPSKALLHAAKVITEAEEMADHGISLGKPKIDLDSLRGWKDSVVGKLVGGLGGLAKQRKVTVVSGVGRFVSANMIAVTDAAGKTTHISFDQACIAAGSEPVTLPFI